MVITDQVQVKMVAPVLRRVNTIGIRFTNGTKNATLLDKVIDEKLGIRRSNRNQVLNWGTEALTDLVNSGLQTNHHT